MRLSYGRGAGVARILGVGVTRSGGVVVAVGDSVTDGLTASVMPSETASQLKSQLPSVLDFGGVVVAVAVGVGLSQIIWKVSILQPSPELLELLAIRHRTTLVCPANGMSTQRLC